MSENSGVSVSDVGTSASITPTESAVDTSNQESAALATPPVQDKFAMKFAALTRKEREVREMEKKYSTREKELNAKYAEYEAKTKAGQDQNVSWIEKLKSKPLDVLQEAGLTYDQLTEMVLNEGNPTVEMKLERMRAEMDSKYKSELDVVKQALKDKEEKEAQEHYERTEQGYKSQLKQVIDSDEKYELTRANNAYDLVFDVVKAYFDETQKVLTPQEAADVVEAELEEEATKILKLKKMQGKFAPQSPAAAKPGQAKETPTLSNNLSAERPVSGQKLLSKEESIREAAKRIVWNE